MEYTVQVIYHQDPRNGIRAVQFFRARPVLVGRILRADTVFKLTEEQLNTHRAEIEPMIRDRIIAVYAPDGAPFQYTERDPGLAGLLVQDSPAPAPSAPAEKPESLEAGAEAAEKPESLEAGAEAAEKPESLKAGAEAAEAAGPIQAAPEGESLRPLVADDGGPAPAGGEQASPKRRRRRGGET